MRPALGGPKAVQRRRRAAERDGLEGDMMKKMMGGGNVKNRERKKINKGRKKEREKRRAL